MVIARLITSKASSDKGTRCLLLVLLRASGNVQISSLKLLEYRQEKTYVTKLPKEETLSEPQKNDTSVDVNSNTGLLGRLKKLFS